LNWALRLPLYRCCHFSHRWIWGFLVFQAPVFLPWGHYFSDFSSFPLRKNRLFKGNNNFLMKKKHEYVTGILTEAKIEPLENFNFMNYLHFFPAKIKKF